MTTLKFSSNPDSYLNRARQMLFDGKQEWSAANRGQGSYKKANALMNEARIRLRQVLYNKFPARQYEPDLKTTIAGIPCGIVITYYSAPRCNNWGHPDDRLPDDPAEVEFFVVDRTGYPAGWLERKADYPALYQWVLGNAQ